MLKIENRPVVSIITIFLNAEKFIEEPIESLLGQMPDHWELVLVDDTSTDKTSEVPKGYAEKYLEGMRYLEHEGH